MAMETLPRHMEKHAIQDEREVPYSARKAGWWSERRVRCILALGLCLSLPLWLVVSSSPGLELFRAKPDHLHETQVGQVTWWNCEGPDVLPGTDCGYILVPLDYFNASAGVAQIALARYKATETPRKGIVLLNPGGPGGEGTKMASTGGTRFQDIMGKGYDMIGFDPRGIGATLPHTQCFEPGAYQAFKSHTVLQRGYDVGPNTTDPFTRERLVRAQKEADALLKTQFAVCKESMGDQLRYMGTSTVVRDIDFITKALEGENTLINYFGGSYGSILGMYLVNMLPDRVGRVVIDGIADAVAWSSKPSYKWYHQWLVSTEDTYRIFVDECSKAGPVGGCALAQVVDEDPSAIRRRIEDFMAKLYAQPLPVPDALNPGILTEALARMYLFVTLQRPTSWPLAASALSQAMNGNGTSLLNSIQPNSDRDLERSAVSCNDNLPYPIPSAEEVIDEWLDVYENVTRFAFSVVTTEPDSGCHYWPVTPPERFHGPWNHTLRNPMLVMSARADPVTPLASGQLVQDLLGESARLVIQNSPGHCALSMPSLCYAETIRNYFEDGTLPPPGTTCEPDVSPFPLPGVRQSFSEEDARILESIEFIGELIANSKSHPFNVVSHLV